MNLGMFMHLPQFIITAVAAYIVAAGLILTWVYIGYHYRTSCHINWKFLYASKMIMRLVYCFPSSAPLFPSHRVPATILLKEGMLLVKNELEYVRGREEERKRRSLHSSRVRNTASPS